MRRWRFDNHTRAHAFEKIEQAQEKALTENNARELLLNSGFLRDVWEKYRVLKIKFFQIFVAS